MKKPYYLFGIWVGLWGGSCSEIPTRPISIAVYKHSILSTGTLTFDISCDNVFSTNASQDWSVQNITSTSNLSIIQNKNCQLSLQQYNDGVDTYTPLSTPLIISITSAGAVSAASPRQYTNGAGSPTLKWFFSSQGSLANSMYINFAADVVTATTSVSSSSLSGKTVSLSVGSITAPTVSNVTVTRIQVLNLGVYTLNATVSGSTGCKYINNTSATYTASSWNSVNTAYNAAGATACPTLGLSGNWTGLWVAGTKILLMWANTSSGVSAYTTAVVEQ